LASCVLHASNAQRLAWGVHSGHLRQRGPNFRPSSRTRSRPILPVRKRRHKSFPSITRNEFSRPPGVRKARTDKNRERDASRADRSTAIRSNRHHQKLRTHARIEQLSLASVSERLTLRALRAGAPKAGRPSFSLSQCRPLLLSGDRREGFPFQANDCPKSQNQFEPPQLRERASPDQNNHRNIGIKASCQSVSQLRTG